MRVLLRKEIRAIVRDGRLTVLAIALLLILIGSLYASNARQQNLAREKTRIEQITRQQWDTQGKQHPHRGAHFGHYVFQPDAALSVINPGIADHVGQALWLEPHRRNFMRFRPAVDAPPHARLGLPTPAFMLTSVLPLLIIGFAFNAITQERETGTLRMLQGAGLSPARLVAGKLLAQLGILGIWLTLLLAATWLFFLKTVPDSDEVLRTLSLGLGYFVYCLTFCALALAASALFRHGRTALLALIMVWALFALVVPRLGSSVANASAALPSAEHFWTKIQQDIENGLPGDDRLDEQVRRFEAGQLRTHGVSRLEDLPVGINAARRMFKDAYSDKVHTHHFAVLARQYDAQQRTLRYMALLSPSLAMQAFSETLAGTDMAHQRHFENAAETYRRYVNATLDGWDADNTRGVTSHDARYADDRLWRSIKHFDYQRPPAAFAWKAALPDFLVLIAWGVFSTVLLMSVAKRVKP